MIVLRLNHSTAIDQHPKPRRRSLRRNCKCCLFDEGIRLAVLHSYLFLIPDPTQI